MRKTLKTVSSFSKWTELQEMEAVKKYMQFWVYVMEVSLSSYGECLSWEYILLLCFELKPDLVLSDIRNSCFEISPGAEASSAPE